MKVAPTPERWVTPTVFRGFYNELMGTEVKKITGGILNITLKLAAAPTHYIDPRVSTKRAVKRIIDPEEVNGKFGDHSLIRLLDVTAAQLAGLNPRNYETLNKFTDRAGLGAGVLLPTDSYHQATLSEPLVAQVIGYDYRPEQAFGVQGLVSFILNNREQYISTSFIGRLVDNQGSNPMQILHEMALPTNDVLLLTNRGLA